MPSIELDGHSDARFVLVDGKIVRQELNVPTRPAFEIERRLRE